MTVNYRALYTWFLFFAFLILVVIRLDEKLVCSWFLVFIPMWIFDFSIVTYLMFHIIRHCVNENNQLGYSQPYKFGFIGCVTLKICFQVLLCLRLEYFAQIRAYQIMIPLWMLLAVLIVNFSRRLLLRALDIHCTSGTCGFGHCSTCHHHH